MDAKRVKRLIYGKPHKALVLNEPGLHETTVAEVERLLQQPLQPLDDEPQVANTEDGILLSCVSFRRLLELAQRLQTAPDILWVLAEKRVASPAELKKALGDVPWDLILPKNAAVRVAADSRASRLYHEGLMREVAQEVLEAQGFSFGRERGARVKLFLHENRLMIALGLLEEPLYKRGNKAELKAPAPLKETLAAGLIQRTVAWLQSHGQVMPRQVYVPFAGSGTLGFEALSCYGDFSWQGFFQPLVLAEAPCFPQETVAFLNRRLVEKAQAMAPLSVLFLDHHEDMASLIQKTLEKMAAFLSPQLKVSCEKDDFFTSPFPETAFFMPLHPPYGDRLGVADVTGFYTRIATKLNEASHVSGFILIPEEAAWSGFLRHLRGFTHATWHVTQGGKDVRVVGFFKGGA